MTNITIDEVVRFAMNLDGDTARSDTFAAALSQLLLQERKRCADICVTAGAYNEDDEGEWCFECARRIMELE